MLGEGNNTGARASDFCKNRYSSHGCAHAKHLLILSLTQLSYTALRVNNVL